MATRHRIRADQLHIGSPLPVDVYDAENRLLLRRGNVIATQLQLQRLVDEGLFSDQPLPSRPRRLGAGESGHEHAGGGDEALVDGPLTRAAAKPKHRVSVLADVTTAAKQLEATMCAPEANPEFVSEISAVAETVRRACALDPDAALAHILFVHDVRYPIRQSINVAVLTALLLQRMHDDVARLHSAVCAALTMNLSILSLQDFLYRQQAMTDAQRKAIAGHPTDSARALAALGVSDALWLAIVEQHHEFVDGSGYPNRLAGDAVLREAQVLGLADRYCAAVTERAYRTAVPPDLVINQIRTKSGTAIDPHLVEELVHGVGLYPPGTVVVLFNRDVCVVTRRLLDPKHPVVVAVSGERLRPYDAPRKRLTASHAQFHIERVLPRETIRFPVDPEVLWPRTVAEEAAVAA